MADFAAGWKLDPEWVWVLEQDEGICGFILASPCHGIAIIMVVKMKQGFGRFLPRLMRGFMKGCQDRGIKGYMSYVNANNDAQLQLLRIAKKAKALVFPWTVVCFGGRIEDAAKW